MTDSTTDLPVDRRLATVEVVAEVEPIEGADTIEKAKVRGWWVVVRKDAFSKGDLVVYFEIDSALPLSDPRFTFLGERSQRKAPDGAAVHVLRTVKLRGTYSQGLVLPVAEFPKLKERGALVPGDDVTELLGVKKWEPPIPAGGAPTKGTFPAFLQKTDAERVQNISPKLWQEIQEINSLAGDGWLAVEKIDGSSVTVWRDPVDLGGALRVAGRNWELAVDGGGAHVIRGLELGKELLPGEWLQGEVAGPSVQNNPLKLGTQRVFLFGFGTTDGQTRESFVRLPRDSWPAWAKEVAAPVYSFELPETIDEAISQVEKLESIVAPGKKAEGVVWTRRSGKGLFELSDRAVWKSISAAYLAKLRD